MVEYRDPVTGYTVRRYTEGPARNAKLYFTTENFSTDDKYFYFNHQQLEGQNDGGTYRCEWATGEITRVTDSTYRGFALDREKNVAYVPGTHFYPDLGHTDTLRLNFSKSTVEEIGRGMKILGEVLGGNGR